MLRLLPCFCFFLLFNGVLSANTWLVGPGKTYTKPSQVAPLVAAGDTVLIDPVEYVADVCFWNKNDLVLRGNGGLAHLNANGTAAGQKAIWVIQGNNTTVEYIEFSNCSVPDKNGAGIRQEGVSLTIRHCYFHDNEMGILAGDKAGSTILVEYSQFAYNGYGDGYSHNIYVNHIEQFIFRYNWSHDCKIGHLVKSRAYNNFILYNRLESQPGYHVSYEIDMPNGGFAVVMGNVIYQPADGDNSNLVSYGQEGLSNPGPHNLYCVNNTLVNAKSTGSFFILNAATGLFKAYNNLVVGGGNFIGNGASALDTAGNIRIVPVANAGFVDAAAFDYHLTAASPAIDKGVNAGLAGNTSLLADKEYEHPANYLLRPVHVALDAGAYEGPLVTTVADPGRAALHCWRSGDQLLHESWADDLEIRVYGTDGHLLCTGKSSETITIPPGLLFVTLWSGKTLRGSKIIF